MPRLLSATALLQLAALLGPFLFLIGPLVTAAHELGHALAALLLSERPVAIQIGRGQRSLRVGRLSLHVGPALSGCCRYEAAGLTIGERITIALAGPLASLATALLLAGALSALPPAFARSLLAGCVLALSQALVNLVPWSFLARLLGRSTRRAQGSFRTHRRASDADRVLALLTQPL